VQAVLDEEVRNIVMEDEELDEEGLVTEMNLDLKRLFD
jgi:hypothetical protein